MAYGDFKDLPRKTASDKVLHDKNPNHDGYQRGLASVVYIKGRQVVVLKMKICQSKN